VGFGLRNGLPVVVNKVLRYNAGYTVSNIDTQYTVTPEALEINQGSSVLTREPGQRQDTLDHLFRHPS